MILSFTSNLFITCIIIGFSYFFKNFLLSQKNDITNIDFIYGIFFIIILSIIANFLIPLKYFKIIIISFGIFSFLLGIIKKKIKINYFVISFLLFFFSFFTYWNGNNADSPVYHFQTIIWAYEYKIPFGLAILDWHYALNSIWHIFLSSFSTKILNFNSIYVINFIPFVFLFGISFCLKNNNLSTLALKFSSIFLLLFSLIHPYKNGIIFNHLGNPEVDTMAMIFFIICGYLFLLFFETQKKNQLNIFIQLSICSLMCILIKLSYVGVIFFPLVLLFYKINFKIFYGRAFIISYIFVSLWSLRNFFLSSCLIFPIKNTCIKTSWSLNNEQVLFYLNQTKSFARDTRLRAKYTDFEHTIYSHDWIIPWLKDYLLNDAFLGISIILILISILSCLIFNYLIPKKKFVSLDFNLFKILIILFLFNFYFWFQNPEIRFGWGIFIFFSCVLFSLVVKRIDYFKILLNHLNYIKILLILLICLKNFSNFEIKNIYTPFEKNFNYSNIVLLKEINGFKVYRSNDWKCAEFKKICINKPKKNYNFQKRFNHIFISTSDIDTF